MAFWNRKSAPAVKPAVSEGALRGDALFAGLERLGFSPEAVLGGAVGGGGGVTPNVVTRDYPILSTSQGAHAVQLNQMMCSGVAVECYHKVKAGAESIEEPCETPPILEYPCYFDESIDCHTQTAEAVFAGLLCGEVFVWKELNDRGTKVVAWWVLANRKVQVHRRRGGVRYLITGTDIAGDPPTGWYDQRNIMHIIITPVAGYRRGLGASQLASLPVAMAVLNNIYGNAAFQNATDIKGIWELKDATQTQVDDFRTTLDKAKGPENAGKDIVSSASATFRPLNPEPSKMQMVGARQRSGIEMSQVTHTNSTQIGEVQQGAMSYAVADAHDVMHTKNVIQPILQAVQRAFNRDISTKIPRILPRGTYMRYNLDHLLRGDERSRAQMIRGLVKDGLLAPNEGRKDLDRRPHPNPDADELIAPSNWGPLGDLMEQMSGAAETGEGDGEPVVGGDQQMQMQLQDRITALETALELLDD